MKFRPSSITVICLISLFAILTPAQARRHDTTVELVDFDGWHDAYRISNGIVDVVVVPGVGRIMQYCFTGHPETSPIWVNPDVAGKPAVGGWQNYGGDKVWPAPQGDWGKHMHQDRNWPPDPAIDPGAFTISRIDSGVRLTGSPVVSFAMTISRDIVVEPGTSKVEITDTFAKSPDATGDADGFPIGIWNVTQTRGDETAYLPFDPNSQSVSGGFVAINEGTPDPTFRGVNWTIGKDELTITTKGLPRGNKVGVDDPSGVVRESSPNGIVFVEKFDYTAGGPYLDNGTDAQVYANDNPEYLEIEAHSPGRNLKAGESMSRTITWNLLKPGQSEP